MGPYCFLEHKQIKRADDKSVARKGLKKQQYLKMLSDVIVYTVVNPLRQIGSRHLFRC